MSDLPIDVTKCRYLFSLPDFVMLMSMILITGHIIEICNGSAQICIPLGEIKGSCRSKCHSNLYVFKDLK